MLFRTRLFRGEIPSAAPELLPPEHAALAQNCDLARGTLAPLAGLGAATPLPHAGDVRRIFLLEGDWLAWTAPVSVVRAFAEDSAGRIFIFGDGPAQLTDHALATTGAGAAYPNGTLRLGIPAPQTAPVLELEGEAGEEVTRSSSYVYTLCAPWSEGGAALRESAPSPPTPVVDVSDGQSVRVSGFALPVLAGLTVSHIRVYRTVAGTSGAAYLFVAEIPATQGAYVDALAEADLPGDALETEGWDAPPDALAGCIATDNGVLVGHAGNTLYVSPARVPYAFPRDENDGSVDYRRFCESEVMGLGHMGGIVVAATRTRPYLLEGADPASMTLRPLPFMQGCVSGASLVNIPGGVAYASAEGLFVLRGVSGECVTRGLFTREQWQELAPQDWCAVLYGGAYLAFVRGTGAGYRIAFDGSECQCFALPGAVWGAHVDPQTDTLHLLTESAGASAVQAFKQGAPLSYAWQSRDIVTGIAVTPRAAQVRGDFAAGGSVTFTLVQDGAEVFAHEVTDDAVFRLPGGARARRYAIRLEGTALVREVRLGLSVSEVCRGG